ncbi:hypothetical protein Syun_022004 [Stephania yunnanensis]|uniref:Uncharacterized protein n=1 Tax=Stephania yunnanensis TaxID=152371 RepID=A0AAP0NPM2_9MAGN
MISRIGSFSSEISLRLLMESVNLLEVNEEGIVNLAVGSVGNLAKNVVFLQFVVEGVVRERFSLLGWKCWNEMTEFIIGDIEISAAGYSGVVTVEGITNVLEVWFRGFSAVEGDDDGDGFGGGGEKGSEEDEGRRCGGSETGTPRRVDGGESARDEKGDDGSERRDGGGGREAPAGGSERRKEAGVRRRR